MKVRVELYITSEVKIQQFWILHEISVNKVQKTKKTDIVNSSIIIQEKGAFIRLHKFFFINV